MELSHRVLHDTLALSSPFLLALIAVAVAVTAVGLIGSRRSRLSAGSRHLLLSIALVAPLVAALAGSVGAPSQRAEITLGSPSMTDVSYGQPLQTATSEVPCTLFGIWMLGALALSVLSASHWIRWARVARRVTTILNPSVKGVRLASSPAAAEPMVVGVFRPIVLLPVGYAESLDKDEMESVFAHELEHVRRRDNLTAALHELATILFWFDPLHWIARRRLLELRERACDERVLEHGCAARPYVAALAKTCHVAIESPAIACMSGFHIQERIESIMNYSSDRAQFLPERIVRIAVVTVALGLITSFAAIAPAPAFAGERSEHRLDVQIRPGTDGRILVELSVTSPDGERVLSSKIASVAGQRVTGSATRGGRTYEVIVTPNTDGSGVAELRVRDGQKSIQHSTQDVKAYKRIDGKMKRPEVLSRVEPIYPAEAKEARIAGIVVVEAQIDETGVVRNVTVLKDRPYGLGESAASAVRQWVFAPALIDGKPVPAIFSVTINFKLD